VNLVFQGAPRSTPVGGTTDSNGTGIIGTRRAVPCLLLCLSRRFPAKQTERDMERATTKMEGYMFRGSAWLSTTKMQAVLSFSDILWACCFNYSFGYIILSESESSQPPRIRIIPTTTPVVVSTVPLDSVRDDLHGPISSCRGPVSSNSLFVFVHVQVELKYGVHNNSIWHFMFVRQKHV